MLNKTAQGIEFTWDEPDLLQGIRQDTVETQRKYRLVRNMNWKNLGALTKDQGIRPILGTSLSEDIWGIFDCHFANSTQILTCVSGTSGSSYSLRYYNSATLTMDKVPGGSTLGQVRPYLTMFADQLHIMDGSQMLKMNSSRTLTNAGGTTYGGAARFGRVYANRLVIGGDATEPYSFFPSNVRNSSIFQGKNTVDVANVHGDEVGGMGLCGSFLIVGGERWCRSYYLGTASPRDWDWDDVSTLMGPASFSSMVDIPAIRGDRTTNACLFWAREGPMMVAQFQSGTPRMFNLWFPIRYAIEGEAYEGMPDFDPACYDDVTATYVPEFDEVRFSVRTQDRTDQSGLSDASPDLCLCVNLSSCLAYASDPGKMAPMWRIRDNAGNYLPLRTLSTARISTISGFPATTGRERVLCGANGQIYEMDARNRSRDLINGVEYPISFEVRRDGYDGQEDSVRVNTKVARTMYARTRQTQASELYLAIIPETGNGIDTTISLPPQSVWSGDVAEGTWGNGGLWSGTGFSIRRAQFQVIGKKFSIELYDNGNLEGGFQLGDWTLLGTLEDRR